MKKELTRKQMIALIASDYGFGAEITNNLRTEILSEVCKSSHPHIHLKALLEFSNTDIYLDKN